MKRNQPQQPLTIVHPDGTVTPTEYTLSRMHPCFLEIDGVWLPTDPKDLTREHAEAVLGVPPWEKKAMES